MAYRRKTKEEQEEQKKYTRATKTVLPSNKTFDDMFRQNVSIYDQALYYLRQEYFRCRDLNWSEFPEYPSWFELCALVKEREAWKNSTLDINIKKQTINSALTNWDAWRASVKKYEADPTGYTGKPEMPRYKYRTQDWFEMSVDKTRFRGSDENKITIPCTKLQLDVPSNLKKDWITELVLTKKNGEVCVSFVYDKRKAEADAAASVDLTNTNILFEPIESRMMSIDLGKVNLAAGMTYGCGTNDGSFVIRGRYFSQKINETTEKIAFLQGEVMQAKNKEVTLISKKDGQLKIYKNTNQMDSIWSSYDNFVDNQVGNITSMIIDYCKERNIGTIIIGYNEGWKEEIELGRQNNREFCHIPHRRILDTLRMKAEYLGMKFIVVEESYTSKTDHMAGEAMCHHDKYLGRRVKRGKFVSSTGKIIHGDVNGCIGMIRKANVIPDAVLIDGLRDRGDVVSPVVLNVRGMNPSKQRSNKR